MLVILSWTSHTKQCMLRKIPHLLFSKRTTIHESIIVLYNLVLFWSSRWYRDNIANRFSKTWIFEGFGSVPDCDADSPKKRLLTSLCKIDTWPRWWLRCPQSVAPLFVATASNLNTPVLPRIANILNQRWYGFCANGKIQKFPHSFKSFLLS